MSRAACASCTCSRARPTRTVAILGAAYGGAHAAQMLAQSLPKDWRLVVIDRQSHMNHVYVFPRFIVVPEHAPKSFVPYKNMVGRNPATATPPTPPATPPACAADGSLHEVVQGHIISLAARSVTVILPDAHGTYDGLADDGSNAPPERLRTVEFDYCIYALGAGLPAPCDVWGEYGREQLPGRGSKAGGIEWIRKHYEIVKGARSVTVVGAGALGIQFSSDIKDLWPEKTVTLIHSRTRMLPRYPQDMHDAVLEGLEAVGVEVILGERVVKWSDDEKNMGILDGQPKTVTTEKGRTVTADIVLACTGPKPHSELMAALEPKAIAPNGRIRVKPTTQVDVPVTSSARVVCAAEGIDAGVGASVGAVSQGVRDLTLSTPDEHEPNSHTYDNSPLDHMFIIGDCADTTAIMAGHTAYWQGEVAARNIQHLIESELDDSDDTDIVDLETYTPGPPAIKITLGIYDYVIASGESVTPGSDGVEDLQARLMWPVFNAAECGDDE